VQPAAKALNASGLARETADEMRYFPLRQPLETNIYQYLQPVQADPQRLYRLGFFRAVAAHQQ
jgi:hypothetical protein